MAVLTLVSHYLRPNYQIPKIYQTIFRFPHIFSDVVHDGGCRILPARFDVRPEDWALEEQPDEKTNLFISINIAVMQRLAKSAAHLSPVS